MPEGRKAQESHLTSSPSAQRHGNSETSSSFESYRHPISWREAAEAATAAHWGRHSDRASPSWCMSPDPCSAWRSPDRHHWCNSAGLLSDSMGLTPIRPREASHADNHPLSSMPQDPVITCAVQCAASTPTSPHAASSQHCPHSHASLLGLLADQHLLIGAYKDHVRKLEAAAFASAGPPGTRANCRCEDVEEAGAPSATAGTPDIGPMNHAFHAMQQETDLARQGCLEHGTSTSSCGCHPSASDDTDSEPQHQSCDGLPQHAPALHRSLPAPRLACAGFQTQAGWPDGRHSWRPACTGLCRGGAALQQRSAVVEQQLVALLVHEQEQGCTRLLPEAACLLEHLTDFARQQHNMHARNNDDVRRAQALSCDADDRERGRPGWLSVGLSQEQQLLLQRCCVVLAAHHGALKLQHAGSKSFCMQLLPQLDQVEQQQQQQQQQQQRAGPRRSSSSRHLSCRLAKQEHVRQLVPAAADLQPPLPHLQQQQVPRHWTLGPLGSAAQRIPAGEHSLDSKQPEGPCLPRMLAGRRRLSSCPGDQRREAACRSGPPADGTLSHVSADQVLQRAQATRALHAEASAEEHQMVAEATRELELLRQAVEGLRAEASDTATQLRACREALQVARAAAQEAEEGRCRCAAAATELEAEVKRLGQRGVEAAARLEEEKRLLLVRLAGLEAELAEGRAAAAAQLEVQQRLESRCTDLEGKVAAATDQVVQEKQQLRARLRLSVLVGHGKQNVGSS